MAQTLSTGKKLTCKQNCKNLQFCFGWSQNPGLSREPGWCQLPGQPTKILHACSTLYTAVDKTILTQGPILACSWAFGSIISRLVDQNHWKFACLQLCDQWADEDRASRQNKIQNNRASGPWVGTFFFSRSRNKLPSRLVFWRALYKNPMITSFYLYHCL